MSLRRIHELVSRLRRHPSDADAWVDLGAIARRAGGWAELASLRLLRGRLRRFMRCRPDRLEFASAMLALLDCEPRELVAELLPSWWRRPSRAAEMVDGLYRDAETGLPLLVRHRRSGIELLLVPGGSVRIGLEGHCSAAYEARRIRLRGFYLGRFPVTVEQYRRFVESASGEVSDVPANAAANLPVHQVTHQEGAEFCRWAGGRLPGEYEWERAGRGAGGRQFPWGQDFTIPDLVPGGFRERVDSTGIDVRVPVGGFPAGASPFGHEELVGHVAQWCFEVHEGRGAVRGGSRHLVRNIQEGAAPRRGFPAANLVTRRSVPFDTRSSHLGFRLCLPLMEGIPPTPVVPPPTIETVPELLLGIPGEQWLPTAVLLTRDEGDSP